MIYLVQVDFHHDADSVTALVEANSAADAKAKVFDALEFHETLAVEFVHPAREATEATERATATPLADLM